MKVILKGASKELADFVLELQSQLEMCESIAKIDLPTVNRITQSDCAAESAQQAINKSIQMAD